MLSGFDFTITHRLGATNPADGPSRRLDYIVKAQKLAQKYNEAFVELIRRILKQGNSTPSLAATVLTRARARSKEQDELTNALSEFKIADKKQTAELSNAEERGETDFDSLDSSESEGSNEDYLGPEQT